MSDNSGPLILAVETSTRVGSVSLARGEGVLGIVMSDGAASRSTDLIENVDRQLRAAEARLSDVDLFAVAVGPGSFTGLRIGLATVKAFAVCVQRPCAAVSTLAAIAYSAGASERTVSVLPAGRGEVYAQMFSVLEGKVEALDRAAHIKPSELLERYGNGRSIKFAGEGAHHHIQTLQEWANENKIVFSELESSGGGWMLASETRELATSVAVLALSDYRSCKVIGADELQANYVRASDAEIHERWLQQNPQPPIAV